jgi:tetratricopeptide (TPR) repeat protein
VTRPAEVNGLGMEHEPTAPGLRRAGWIASVGNSVGNIAGHIVGHIAGPVLLGLVLRAVYLLESAGNPFRDHLFLDLRFYDLWARRILTDGFCGPGVYLQAPLYAHFLAAVYGLPGPDVQSALWMQVILGAATAGLGAWVSSRLWGRTAGWVSGLLLALYQPGLFYTGVLLVPVVATFLLALALAFAFRRPWLAGVCTGLAGLGHPLLVPGGLLAALAIALRGRAWRQSRRIVAAVGLGCLLGLAPATLHNLICGHALVPIAANAGINLYIGNGPAATGFYVPVPGADGEQQGDILGIQQASRLSGRSLDAVQASRFWAGAAARAVGERPVRALRLAVLKIYAFLQAYEVPQVESLAFERRYSRLLRLPLLPGWLALLGLALAGWAQWRRDRAYAGLLGAVAATALVTAAFFVTARFRFPLHLYLAVAAGAGGEALRRILPVHGAGRVRSAAVATLGPAILAIVIFGVPWSQATRPRAFGELHYRLGQLAEADGRDEDAQREYGKALELAPRHHAAAIQLGLLTARAGDLERARALFERGLALDPRNAGGLLALGQVHQARGELAPACSLYALAWEADTTLYRALESLATACYARGEIVRAESLCVDLLRRMEPGAAIGARCRFLLQRFGERRAAGLPLWQSRARAEADLALAVRDQARAQARYAQALEAGDDPVALLELGRLAALRRDARAVAGWRERFMDAGGDRAVWERLVAGP